MSREGDGNFFVRFHTPGESMVTARMLQFPTDSRAQSSPSILHLRPARSATRAAVRHCRMAPVVPDPKKIKAFKSEAAFEEWMRANHARETEIWVRLYKKRSRVASVTNAEALDVALCWGWIDGIRKGLDEQSFLQRYTPRRARSIWSQINRDHVKRLTVVGRMQPAGHAQIDAAKADG